MYLKISTSILLMLFTFGYAAAQKSDFDQERAGRINFNQHAISLSTGVDYAIMPLSIGYKYGIGLFDYQFPFEVGGDISIPMFSFDLSDIRIRASILGTAIRRGDFELNGAIRPLFVQTKMQTQTMSSLGSDFYLYGGWVTPHWSLGAEITYNTIFTTRIQHTAKFKDNVYSEVRDGWYRNTAGNFHFGVSATRRFNAFDVFIKTGYATTSRFQGYLFVPPIYATIGATYIFGKN